MTVDDRTPELAELVGWTDDDMSAYLEDAAEREHREAQLAEEPADYAEYAGLADDAPTPALRCAA